jgi:opine dehydrogenase
VQAGAITLKDADGSREVALALATADIAAALKGAELIVIPTPAIAQHDIALAMAPHLVDGQVVFLPPGTFGSYVMARTVKEAGNHADVAWAETGTLPYLARKHGEREVNVTIRAIRLPTGVYPRARRPRRSR